MLQLSAVKADAVRRLVFSLQRSRASRKRPGRAAGESRQPETEAKPTDEEVIHLLTLCLAPVLPVRMTTDWHVPRVNLFLRWKIGVQVAAC